MMNNKFNLALSSLVILFLSFSSIIYAQQINLVPISQTAKSVPDLTQTKSNRNPLSFNRENQQQLESQQPQPYDLKESESLSQFEQYISKKIDITAEQFNILKKYNIGFSYDINPPPSGSIKVPVKIISRSVDQFDPSLTNEHVVDAGFLIGTQEQIYNAFIILGIKSPYTISAGLRQFGYDLFKTLPMRSLPNTNVPVSPGYVLGPGDEVRVTVWGKVEGNWDIIVDRNGNISIPKIGVFGITGLTFSEMKNLLHKEFSKYYTGFEMNVSLGALRTIKVYVVGNALRPGTYTVSSLSTLVTALFEAGGPNKNGTMRDIQLRRNGDEVVHFDMYDFLLKGEKAEDVRLMSEDVIFIPYVGKLAAIAGSVKNPAIYELKGETSLAHMIEMAGGLNDIAFKGRIQIARIVENSSQTVFESSLDGIKDNDITIQSGDIVKIFQIVQDRKTVRLTGAVKRAGEYGYSKGMTVKDLIMLAGGPNTNTFTKETEITRVNITNEGPVTEKIIINLQDALSGDPNSNILLQENDYIFIRTIPEWTLYKTVTIGGEVNFPGTYTIKKGESLSSLIDRAGGYTDKAYLRGARFTRERIKTLQQKQIDEMIDRFEMNIFSKGALETSAAASPEEAKIKEIEFKQQKDFIEKAKQLKANGRMVIVLAKQEQMKNSQYDIELEDNDSLYIPQNPRSIQVIGSVNNQTAFMFDKSKNANNYITLAGGYGEYADKKKTYILKVDGTAVSANNGSSGISWNSDSFSWEFGISGLEPGDTIVVPEKLDRIAWMRNVKDVTQILYQIATAAGVLIVAF